MANGKKNYFRHSFFAHNDIKLLKLKDEVGIGFYFYFFSLLELCGEESSDKLSEEYEFHNTTIRSLWGVNLKKSEHVASVMCAVGLLEFKKLQKSFWFKIPNFSKYLGRYQNKIEPNTPKKRKEKERKEKKKKVKKRVNTGKPPKFNDEINRIVEYLNEKANKKFHPTTEETVKFITKRISEGYTYENFTHVVDVKTKQWLNDPKMYEFLCPATLFGDKHFEKYLNQKAEFSEDDIKKQMLKRQQEKLKNL